MPLIGKRIIALLIDMALVLMVESFVMIIGFIIIPQMVKVNPSLGGSGGDIYALFLGGVTIVSIIAIAIIQTYSTWQIGKTLGKRIMKLHVVRTNGQNLSLPRSITRELFFKLIIVFIPFLSPLYLLASLIAIFATKGIKSIHDYILDTIVEESR